MTAKKVLSGHQFRYRSILHQSPAIKAAIRSIGPDGRAAVYAQGNSIKRAESAIEIIRHFSGDSAEETILKEEFVSAQQDLGDGIARLAAIFDGALCAVNELLAAGVHPTQHSRAVSSLLGELDRHFESVTTPYAGPDSLINTFDLPDTAVNVIKEALSAAGEGGHVEVSENDEPGVQYQQVKGFIADMKPLTRGPFLPMDQVYVLVINDILQDQSNLLSIIEGFANSDKSLVIAARGLAGSAKQLLEINRSSGVLRVVVFEPEQKGTMAELILADLAAATGATLVCEKLGQSLSRLTPNMLGMASGCRIQGSRMILSEPKADASAVAMRLKEIEADIHKARYLELDRENSRRRYARLAGNWVEITVGKSATTPGLHERVSRACSAVRMAQHSGVIAGGGVGLTAVADRLAAKKRVSSADNAAIYMLTRALKGPQQALRQNAAKESPVQELSDPAELSRKLAHIASSLALQFMTIEAAVLRS